jgi:hypothetical protein
MRTSLSSGFFHWFQLSQRARGVCVCVCVFVCVCVCVCVYAALTAVPNYPRVPPRFRLANSRVCRGLERVHARLLPGVSPSNAAGDPWDEVAAAAGEGGFDLADVLGGGDAQARAARRQARTNGGVKSTRFARAASVAAAADDGPLSVARDDPYAYDPYPDDDDLYAAEPPSAFGNNGDYNNNNYYDDDDEEEMPLPARSAPVRKTPLLSTQLVSQLIQLGL